MPNTKDRETRSRHLRMTEASAWVRRFQPLVPAGGTVLDLAAGGGRHGRYFLGLGHPVVAVDRETAAMADLAREASAEVIEADLENGAGPFARGGPLAGRTFAGIVVVNYLYRPLMDGIIAALDEGGVLIYETFARGNERFQKPRNPDHLLKSGELLALVEGRLQVVAYEHGIDETPDIPGDIPGVKQRLCAVNDLGRSDRDDAEPAPHSVASGK